MIKQRLPDLGQIILASDLWNQGDDRDFWLSNETGNMRFCEEKPDKPFAVLKRTTDIDAIESVPEPTVYVEWPSGRTFAFFPDSWDENAPYEGRIFSLGTFDCYSLVRDYYRRERGYEMPHQTESMENLKLNIDTVFTESDELNNWEEVISPQPGDGIFFSIRASDDIKVPNHCGVYLGDDKFMHHMAYRLSTEEKFTDSWKRRVVKYLRHRDG
jgi:cell wall-associated NlpC family hydrolase